MSTEKKQIYLVISQTGTMLSRIIKLLTGAKYNHASISLVDDLKYIYSFGRVNPYNPFIGGFVLESARFGTFKRFKNTTAKILAVDVTDEQYKRVADTIHTMWSDKSHYKYNYLGLFLAAIKINRKKTDCYYCSEFVAKMVTVAGLVPPERYDKIVHPLDFFEIPHKEIYSGKLRDYKKP